MVNFGKYFLLGFTVLFLFCSFSVSASQLASGNTKHHNIKSSASSTQSNYDFANSYANTSEEISYIPRVYGAGYGGDDFLGKGDLLIPLYLTEDRTFVLYGQGRSNSSDSGHFWEQDSWSGSGGLLYRQIYNDMGVLGAYVLGDYNRISGDHHYWTISPGLESLGRVWDFNLNGYFAVGMKSWIESTKGWANNFEFQEGTNNVYDHILQYVKEEGVGGIGGDAQIGRKLFKFQDTLVKGYVQGYYYNMNNYSDIVGGGVKITIQPSRYLKFSLNDTYDEYQGNVFMVGVQIRLNDIFNKSNKSIDENNLSNRLLDPIDRNFGVITSGAMLPIHQNTEVNDLGRYLLTSNGVFFDDLGSYLLTSEVPFNALGSGYHSPNQDQYPKGTYGNPYTEEIDLYNDPNGMQGIFDKIRSQFTGPVYMFFAPGTYYTSTSFGNELGMGNPVQLADGMYILGRDYWYTKSTFGDDRALFIGSLELLGNNFLDSGRIQNFFIIENIDTSAAKNVLLSQEYYPNGIAITDGVGNVLLNNFQVGLLSNPGGYEVGVYVGEGSSINLRSSQIYSYLEVNENLFGSTVGIWGAMGSTINVETNNIIESIVIGATVDEVEELLYDSYLSNEARGIYLSDHSFLNIGDNNTIFANSIGGGLDNVYVYNIASGIYGESNDRIGQVNIGNNNIITAIARGGRTIFTEYFVADEQEENGYTDIGLINTYDAISFSSLVTSFGIYLENFAMSMGNDNVVSSNAQGGTFYNNNSSSNDYRFAASSYGISGFMSELMIENGNNILSDAQGGSSYNSVYSINNTRSFSIYGYSSDITIGNNNYLHGHAIGGSGLEIEEAENIGVYGGAGSIGIIGGSLVIGNNNTIEGFAQGGVGDSGYYVRANTEAYGIIANNLESMLLGHNNSISGYAAGGITTKSENGITSAVAAGVYLNETNFGIADADLKLTAVSDLLVFIGNTNAITGTASAGSSGIVEAGSSSVLGAATAEAYGIYGILGDVGLKQLIIEGGNFIKGSSIGGSAILSNDSLTYLEAELFSRAYGIFLLGDSQELVLGSNNFIEGNSTGGVAYIDSNDDVYVYINTSAGAYGIYMEDVRSLTMNNNNTVETIARGGQGGSTYISDADVSAISIGIWTLGTTVAIGSNNTFNDSAISGCLVSSSVPYEDSLAIGFYGNNLSRFTFGGGSNIFNVNASVSDVLADSQAFGIQVENGSTVVFDYSKIGIGNRNVFNINSGDISNGIYADIFSSLEDEYSNKISDDLIGFFKHNSFNRLAGNSGDMIDWNGDIVCTWLDSCT